MPLPTEAEIMNARQTRAQLRAWGVPWPPPKGWRRILVGVSRAHYAPSLFDDPPASPAEARPRAAGPERPISPATLDAIDAEEQRYDDLY